ncbi:hypothetical protein SNEBB_007467 [Seison nebaliae]|nr:hypothetical protein SNEBB_007467 [Seison nebaliae]
MVSNHPYLPIPESVLYERLMVEGDSSMDDKRITTLIRNLFQLLVTTEVEKQELLIEDSIELLDVIQLTNDVTQRQLRNELETQEKIDKLQSSMEDDRTRYLDTIKEAEIQLEDSLKKRDYKIVYNEKAIEIKKHPPRKTSEVKLFGVAREIKILETNQEFCTEMLRIRQRQFYNFSYSYSQLKRNLHHEEEMKKKLRLIIEKKKKVTVENEEEEKSNEEKEMTDEIEEVQMKNEKSIDENDRLMVDEQEIVSELNLKFMEQIRRSAEFQQYVLDNMTPSNLPRISSSSYIIQTEKCGDDSPNSRQSLKRKIPDINVYLSTTTMLNPKKGKTTDD